MTNAEKYKEVFGFNLNIQAFSEGDICPFVSEKCRELPCPDCINNYWQSDYQGEPTIPLSVIEKIKAEIEELGIWHEKLLIETIDIKRVLEIIDKAVKECTHET